jgi:hypothetical protein
LMRASCVSERTDTYGALVQSGTEVSEFPGLVREL